MPSYKNNSSSIKTFYGVEFMPGEVHHLPRHIDIEYMLEVRNVIDEQEDVVENDESLQPSEGTDEVVVLKKTRTRKAKVEEVVEEVVEDTSSGEPILSKDTTEEGEENG